MIVASTLVHDQSLLTEISIYLLEQPGRQTLPLQPMAKAQDCALIRDRIQINADKATHRFRVVETVFGRRITQTIPLLQKINAQHRRERHRRPARMALRVKPIDRLDQQFPGNDRIHFL